MKKKTKIIIIGTVVLLLLVLGIIILILNQYEKETIEKRVVKEYRDSQTITCIKEKNAANVEETEEVYMEKGVVITRTNTARWSNSDSLENSCKYYTNKTAGLTGKPGVNVSTNCNETSGVSTIIYTLAEIDKEDIRLKQFDYIDSENHFNYNSWIIYMEQGGYSCTIKY